MLNNNGLEQSNLDDASTKIIGTDGRDVIVGKNGDETYLLKGGNDTVKDYFGSDTYLFNLGDGFDEITDNNGTDKIIFGAGITLDNLEFTTNGNTLSIKIKGTDEGLMLVNWLQTKYQIENIVLGNGQILTANDIKSILSMTPTEGDDTLYGDNNANTIDGLGGNDSIYGVGGNDKLIGGYGNDIIEGGIGDDSLYGDDLDSSAWDGGNDTLKGGIGNDLLIGGTGDDTYIFNKGDGQDTISDYLKYTYNEGGFNDVIKFGAGITKDDLIVNAKNLDVVINIKNTNDQITIKNWGPSEIGYNKIEKFEFTDGSTLTASEIEDMFPRTIIGTDGNDNIYGSWLDTNITGGKGNDTIHDGEGNNIFNFNKGDGQDYIDDIPLFFDVPGVGTAVNTIKFGPGITEEDLVFTEIPGPAHKDLEISIKNSTDKITVHYIAESAYGLDKIEFVDGNYLTGNDIYNILKNPPITPTVLGTDGNDKFVGYNGNDIYELKKGYDTVKDYFGNDTYLFNKGDDGDIITDNNGNDTIKFGSGITKNDLEFVQNGSSLSILIENSNDKIDVVNWFSQSKYQIKNVEFSDGSIISNSEINGIIQQISSFKASAEIQIMPLADKQNSIQELTLIQS